MAPSDPYKVLGVARDASDAAVRKAYKKLARRYHPDVNPGDQRAEERFKEISEAYAVLSDRDKREAYDRFGTARPPFGGGTGPGPGGGVSWEDLGGFGFAAGEAGGSVGDIFSRLFGGARRAEPARPRRGEDLEALLRISFMSSIHGLTTPLTLARRVAQAGGAGAAARETIHVKIPAGVADATRLRVAGKGRQGPAGTPDGDLHVTIQVEPHPFFERRGDNIYCKVPVSVTEAALGARIDVPTVDGTARLTVRAGTQAGQHLRLRGKGARRLRGGRGDQFVEIRVVVPEVIDDETRVLLEQLEERSAGDLRAGLFGSRP